MRRHVKLADSSWPVRPSRPRAETAFRTSIERDPWHAGSYQGLAALLASLGRFGEAVACLESVLEIRPGFAGWMLELGRYAISNDDLPKAEVWLKRCLELEPDNSFARAQLAEVYYMSGQAEPAKAIVEAIVAADCTHTETLRSLLALMIRMVSRSAAQTSSAPAAARPAAAW